MKSTVIFVSFVFFMAVAGCSQSRSTASNERLILLPNVEVTPASTLSAHQATDEQADMAAVLKRLDKLEEENKQLNARLLSTQNDLLQLNANRTKQVELTRDLRLKLITLESDLATITASDVIDDELSLLKLQLSQLEDSLKEKTPANVSDAEINNLTHTVAKHEALLIILDERSQKNNDDLKGVFLQIGTLSTKLNDNTASPAIQNELRKIQASITRVQKQLGETQALLNQQKPADITATQNPVTDNLTDLQKSNYIYEQIENMTLPKADLEEIIANIRQYENLAVPALIATIKLDADNKVKLHACKQCLIRIGSIEVIDMLTDELSDKDTTSSTMSIYVDILSEIGSRKAEIPLLRLLNRTESAYLKLDVADALAKMGNKKGISTLIDFLYSEAPNKRFLAIQSLRSTFSTTRGYLAFDTEEARNKAIDDWKAWFDRIYND